MSKDQKLPSDALTKRTNPVKVAIVAAASVVLVAGLSAAAFAIGPTLKGSLNHPTTAATTAAPADTVVSLTDSELAQIQQAADEQQATIAAPADTVVSLTDSELAQIQQAADEQQATIAAEQKAAADAAAAQAAADAAAQAAAHRSSGPVRCPAGSMANSGNGGNDTSCFPDICFHITLPDPAHPECVTAFKP